MASATLLGSTGLVGSHILSTLLHSTPSITTIDIIARRQPPQTTTSPTKKIQPFISSDTTKWAPHLSTLHPSLFITSMATTRSAAGSLEKQYALEHDLNVSLASTARERDTPVLILISVAGASSTARFAYTRMKGDIERDMLALDFPHTVIVRPGLIVGDREESRPAEAVVRKIAGVMGKVNSRWLKDFWAQDADVIARAAVRAGTEALEGRAPEGKVWVLEQADIVRLGRVEA